MRPAVYTVTGTETSNVYVPDHYLTPFNISLGVTVSGTSNYTVQYTDDEARRLEESFIRGESLAARTQAGD